MPSPHYPRRVAQVPTTDALAPIAAATLALADGSRSVAEIAALVAVRCGVERENVHRVLDALADLGLVERRATPPGGSLAFSRRLVWRGAAAGLAGLSLATAQAQTLPEPSPTPEWGEMRPEFRESRKRFEERKQADGRTAAPPGKGTPTPRSAGQPSGGYHGETAADTEAQPTLPPISGDGIDRRQEQTVKRDQERYDKLLERR